MPASAWYGNVPAPDLSNVVRQARGIGRNTALSAMYEDLLKQQKEAAKQAADDAKAEKEAAAQDLAHEPESDSFWQNLGEKAGESLWWTIDKLSRFNYGSANFIDDFVNNGEDDSFDWAKYRSKLNGDFSDKLSTIGDVWKTGTHSWWEGFSGKEKEYFSDVMKKHGVENKWATGLGGFALDVATDPTTYIGAGLVTKPLKKAAEHKIERSVIDDLSNLGLTTKDANTGARIPITAEQYESILGGGRSGLDRPANWDALSKREKRAWRNANTVKGTRPRLRSTDIAATNKRINILRDVYKGLEKNPNISKEELAHLDELISKTSQDLATSVEKYGSKAYKDALAKFDESSVTLAGSVEKLDHLVTVESLRKGLKAKQMLAKGLAQNGKFDNQAIHDEAFAFLQSDKLSDEFKATWAEKLDAAKRQGHYDHDAGKFIESEWTTHNRAAGVLSGDIKRHEAAGEHGKIQAKTTARIEAWKARDTAEARTLYRLIAHDANIKAMREDPAVASRVNDILADMRHLDENIARLDAQAMDRHAVTVSSAKNGKKAGLEGDELGDGAKEFSADELRDLKQQRRELADELDAMQHKWYKENPDKSFWNSSVSDAPVVREGDAAFPKARVKFWEKRTKEIYEQKLATAQREMREGGTKRALKTMMKDNKFIVRGKDGDSLSFQIPADRKKLEDMATTRDKRAYEAKSNKTITHTGGKDFEDHIRSLAHIVFEREFKKQHGYSLDEARDMLARQKGRYVEHNGTAYTKNDYIDAVFESPEKFARSGSGIKVMPELLDKGIRKETKKSADSVSGVTFRQWETYANSELKLSATEIRAKWDDAFGTMVTHEPKKARSLISQNFEYRVNRQIAERQGKKGSGLRADNTVVPDVKKAELHKAAEEEAKREIDMMDEIPNLTDEGIGHHFKSQDLTLAEQHRLMIENARHEFAEGVRQEKLANPNPRSNVAQRTKELARLKAERDAKIEAYNLAYEEAKKAQVAMRKRLREQVDLNALDEAIREGQVYVRLNFMGAKLADIPVAEELVGAIDAFSRIPVIAKTKQAWGEAFRPASALEPEMNLARLRMQSDTANIIKHHMEDIVATFSKFKPKDRKYAFRELMAGRKSVPELSDKLDEYFSDLLKYFNDGVMVGEKTLKTTDLNLLLPNDFRIIHPKGGSPNDLPLTSVPNLFKYMRNLPKDTDPMKALWSLRIAAEQAQAKAAMQHTIAKTFGVKRMLNQGELAGSTKSKLVEALHKKHDWITNANIGHDYYFPRDVSENIDTLFKMTKPQEVAKVLRGYDKILKIWKASVTIYNPGYYSRNAIGETFMNMIDNVWDPKYYSRSAKILAHKMPDKTNEVLKKMEPWKNYESPAQAGARKVVRLKGGKELSADEVWVLYNDVGLKSGFISTEYDQLFPAGNTLRATAPGQAAKKINDAMRSVGEKQEDYFRLAHFISRMERSGWSDPMKAAEEAAEYVRKFHFDYTDFTPFEKATMMRIIPFYKWTRKAMPLMTSMLFTRPGAVQWYPKAMSSASMAMGGVQPGMDDNGFAPNYDGVVPAWIQAIGAYPMGENDQGEMEFMNIATPAQDIYKMVQNPMSAVIGMLSPGIKMPLEQGTGRTLDPAFDIEFDKVEGSRQDNLARMTPITSLIDKMGEGKADKETWLSFVTGLGFYRNSEERQMGEKLRRSIENAK